jgi:hypothetical protein
LTLKRQAVLNKSARAGKRRFVFPMVVFIFLCLDSHHHFAQKLKIRIRKEIAVGQIWPARNDLHLAADIIIFFFVYSPFVFPLERPWT